MWTNKLICSCGSGFRHDLWGKNKAGVPSWGYRCYNKLNHGSAKVRREAGLDTTDFCEMKMLPQWRLDLIAEHIFEDTFVNKRAVFAKALELVKKYYRPDNTSPEIQKSDTEIKSTGVTYASSIPCSSSVRSLSIFIRFLSPEVNLLKSKPPLR
ncbi:MAG: hypothetical protein IKH78_00630 [Ruminococcus sp.]|nr:hypothetical protein [Ruminococcus sp.]